MDSIALERAKLVDELPIDRKELARRAKCSPGTLSDWINHKRPVREHLHDAIMRAIEESQPNSGREPADSQSVMPGVEMRDDSTEYLTLTECKARIKQLEQELAELRIALRVQAREISSAPPSEAAILARRAAGEPPHPKS